MAQTLKSIKFEDEMIAAIENWPNGDGFGTKAKDIISYVLFNRKELQSEIDKLNEQLTSKRDELWKLTDQMRDTRKKSAELLKLIGAMADEVEERYRRW